MSRQSILRAAIPTLTVAGLLFLAGPSPAQHHGGGHTGGHGGGHGGAAHVSGGHVGAAHVGGGWHGGDWHGGGWHGGGWHGGYYGGYRHHYPYYLFGLGYYPRYYGYSYPGYYDYSYPGYYSSYYSNSPSSYYDDYPWSGYASEYSGYTPEYSNYTPSPYTYGTAPALTNTSVHIDVRVPPDADVWFNDTPTAQKGSMRPFESPPLEPSYNYTYDIRARWMDNGRMVDQTRHFAVHAGEQLYVDFLAPVKQSAAGAVSTTGR